MTHLRIKNEFPWYSLKGGLFSKNYLRQYKEMLTPQRTKEEVDCIEKVLKIKPSMEILDLCCGYGRHSIELAKRGYEVTGQDINPLFLKEAKKTAQKAGVKIRWIKRDMRKISSRREFDVILNLFTSFGYFKKEEDHQKVISEVYKALKPKGFFLLDVINRERMIREYQRKDFLKFKDGSILIIERDFDFIKSRNNERRIIIKKSGKRKEVNLSVRIFTLTELISMCKKADLIFKKSYGNYRRDPISSDSKRYILIAQKP